MDYKNVAIIAHVDHGKTTLVDGLLQQSGVFHERADVEERFMDSISLERERGITILAKNVSVRWNDHTINLVDTPGHADFGGEVERALSMVDAVLLLVDAAEGPMPQTRFVLQKALQRNLKPILVINKIDRKDARPDEVLNETFDLMVELGASDWQLDFPVLHAIAKNGAAWRDGEPQATDLAALFETVVEQATPREAPATEAPVVLQVANLDHDDHVGRIAIGRLEQGTLRKGQALKRMGREGKAEALTVRRVATFQGANLVAVEDAEAGNIVALAGLADVEIGDTIADPSVSEAKPFPTVEPPTISVTISPNSSPFAGRDGSKLTGRQLADRLERELLTNVALHVESLGGEHFRVSGRGELHLSILLENMRREGFELTVSPPAVVQIERDGVTCEPYEDVRVDVPTASLGGVIEALNMRQARMTDLQQGTERSVAFFRIPSRSLFGFRNTFMSLTSGEGQFNKSAAGFLPAEGASTRRAHGSLVAMEAGTAMTYSLFKLQDRGSFFIEPGTDVYVGMVIGRHIRAGDLEVNVTKNKKLTNVRASGSDDAMVLTPPLTMGIEEALTYVTDDERIEITPKAVRIRKATLDPKQRKRLAS